MANFYTNMLVFAAHEREMAQILRMIGLNISSRLWSNRARAEGRDAGSWDESSILDLYPKGDGWFDPFSDSDDIAQLYRGVEEGIDGFYWHALHLGPIQHPEWVADHAGYAAGDEYRDLVARLRRSWDEEDLQDYGSPLERQRPLSDAGSSWLERHGATYVFAVRYCTAWNSDLYENDEIFDMLEGVSYGFAYLGKDESWCEELEVQTDDGAFKCDFESAGEELFEFRRETRAVDLSRVDNLSHAALVFAARCWDEYEDAVGDEFEETLEEGYDACGDDFQVFGRLADLQSGCDNRTWGEIIRDHALSHMEDPSDPLGDRQYIDPALPDTAIPEVRADMSPDEVVSYLKAKYSTVPASGIPRSFCVLMGENYRIERQLDRACDAWELSHPEISFEGHLRKQGIMRSEDEKGE